MNVNERLWRRGIEAFVCGSRRVERELCEAESSATLSEGGLSVKRLLEELDAVEFRMNASSDVEHLFEMTA